MVCQLPSLYTRECGDLDALELERSVCILRTVLEDTQVWAI